MNILRSKKMKKICLVLSIFTSFPTFSIVLKSKKELSGMFRKQVDLSKIKKMSSEQFLISNLFSLNLMLKVLDASKGKTVSVLKKEVAMARETCLQIISGLLLKSIQKEQNKKNSLMGILEALRKTVKQIEENAGFAMFISGTVKFPRLFIKNIEKERRPLYGKAVGLEKRMGENLKKNLEEIVKMAKKISTMIPSIKNEEKGNEILDIITGDSLQLIKKIDKELNKKDQKEGEFSSLEELYESIEKKIEKSNLKSDFSQDIDKLGAFVYVDKQKGILSFVHEEFLNKNSGEVKTVKKELFDLDSNLDFNLFRRMEQLSCNTIKKDLLKQIKKKISSFKIEFIYKK